MCIYYIFWYIFRLKKEEARERGAREREEREKENEDMNEIEDSSLCVITYRAFAY